MKRERREGRRERERAKHPSQSVSNFGLSLSANLPFVDLTLAIPHLSISFGKYCFRFTPSFSYYLPFTICLSLLSHFSFSLFVSLSLLSHFSFSLFVSLSLAHYQCSLELESVKSLFVLIYSVVFGFSNPPNSLATASTGVLQLLPSLSFSLFLFLSVEECPSPAESPITRGGKYTSQC